MSHSLFKRRQIRGSQACATATAYLLRRVIESGKATDAGRLVERVHRVGQRLVSAQPRELAIGNIVRRVLGVIREEAEEDREGDITRWSDAGTDSRPHTPRDQDLRSPELSILASKSFTSSPLRHGDKEDQGEAHGQRGPQRPPLLTSHTSYAITNAVPTVTSMFSLLSQPVSNIPSPTASPGSQSPGIHQSLSSQALSNPTAAKDLKAEVVEGIQEILEELTQADDQIASYGAEHIHSNEIILTHTASITVQKFLLKAAAKRKFTVVHSEAYPNSHEATHATTVGSSNADCDDNPNVDRFQKSLTAAGITVILIPDSAVFALMSRVNKVILDTHIVLANGSLIAVAGAKAIAKAAKLHATPVVVLSGVFKLSPVYPFNIDSLMENGDPSKVIGFNDGEFMDKVEIENPLFDYVPVELVSLFITNL